MTSSDQNSKLDTNQALITAQQAATKSRKILLEKFGLENSDLDAKVEEIIRRQISKTFPNHNIIGEEKGFLNNNSDYTWVIDPLDGTRNYDRGIPIFTTSIALFYKNEPILGLIDVPISQDRFWALKGEGAFLNGKAIEVSDRNNLKTSFLYLESPTGKEETSKIFNRLSNEFFRLRVLGIGTLGLAYLAQGVVEAYVDLSGTTKLVDLAAGIILVQEAGGFLQMEDELNVNEKRINGLWACNQKIKNELETVLNST